MVILALADIHGAHDRAASLPPPCHRADLVLVAGDLTDYGGAAEARRVLSALDWARGKLAAVPGNSDKLGARSALVEEGVSADGRVAEIGGVFVAGSGGSQLRTGMTPYERRDRDLAESLRAGLAGSDDRSGKPLVVLTHAPPKGSGADERRGSSCGSQSLMEALESIAPTLWVCGHIHESPCALEFGPSLVVNPGALHDGRYALIRIDRGGGGAWRAAAELLDDA